MLLSGLLLRIPVYEQPKGPQVFDDASYWSLPEGFPSAGVDHKVEKNENDEAAADV